jgi:hypothetical protein
MLHKTLQLHQILSRIPLNSRKGRIAQHEIDTADEVMAKQKYGNEDNSDREITNFVLTINAAERDLIKSVA